MADTTNFFSSIAISERQSDIDAMNIFKLLHFFSNLNLLNLCRVYLNSNNESKSKQKKQRY